MQIQAKMTRRQFAEVTAAGSLVAAGAIAQSPTTAQDLDKAARESHRQNSEVLKNFEIPMSLEPAFQFKA
jgi:hypothetical protein